MKNPGCSKPTSNTLTEQELSNLNSIDNPTMNAIVNLFRKRAESKGEIFEGVIQIFNITNVMSPNLNEALKLFQSTSDPLKSTWEIDINNIISPVYINTLLILT